MNPSPVARVVLALSAFDFGAEVLKAQTTPTKEPENVPIDQVPARVAKLDEAWQQQVEAVRKVIDQEEAAKRITESAAQSLRFTLRNATNTVYDNRNAISSAKLPSDNPALSKAFRDLETSLQTLQADRNIVFEGALKEVRSRISKLMQEAATVAEVDKLIASIESIQPIVQRRSGYAGGDLYGKLSNATVFLGNLRRLFEAEASGNVSVLATAMNEVRANYIDREVVSEVDRRKRLEAAVKPYEKAESDAEEALITALESQKPIAEIMAAFSKYMTAAENRRSIHGFDGRQTKDTTSSYRSLVEYWKAMDSSDFSSARQRSEMARNAALEIGGDRRVRLDQIITKFERDMADQERKRVSAQRDELRKKIAGAKNADDVEAVLTELRDSQNAPRRGGEMTGPNPIVGPLIAILNAWRTNNLSHLQGNESLFSTSAANFETEIAALRSRVTREITAAALRAPEVNQPPLAEKPLADAIEALCDQMAEKRDWRRLLQLLDARTGLPAADGRTYGVLRPGEDATTAIRAYFVAQNFELAEMWQDAAESYRTVLRTTSLRAPVAEAAAALKKLAKEHPEVNRTAETSPILKVR